MISNLTLAINRLLAIAHEIPVQQGGVQIHGAANGWRVMIKTAKTSIEVEGHDFAKVTESALKAFDVCSGKESP